MKMEKIGLIGLGIMGSPMARNLLAGGVDLTVSDVDAGKVRALVELGAKAGSNKEIGEHCDIVFLMLPMGEIVKQVLFGAGGVAEGLQPGKIVCDMSSVTADESRYCHERLEEMGIAFMDAPVSGGEPGAIAGTLAIMCGGEEPVFRRLKPYFDIMGSSAMLIGPSGSGSITKLANQVIVNLNIAVVGEALVFATKAGVDPMKVYHAIRAGLAGSSVLDAKAPMMCARNFKPGGSIKINHKDIKNALDTANKLDIPMVLTAQLFEIQKYLKIHGCLENDHSAYVKYFESLADVEVKAQTDEKK